MSERKVFHSGRFTQTGIYLGKFFRMFVYQNDWKVIPMAAVIAALVSFVVGANLFKTMEGTLTGSFALACICIWNGFFNSIQVVCRERAIVKREHRSGMYISAYIGAHMIYQAFLCLCQSVITIFVCSYMGVGFPEEGILFSMGKADIGVTVFLTTYAADMMALVVSSLVRNTTTAMTVVPFLLIFQLLFSGIMFEIPAAMLWISNLTVAKWGVKAICAQGRYNDLPMVTLWNTMYKFREVEMDGHKVVLEAMQKIEESGGRQEFLMKSASYNTMDIYASRPEMVLGCWCALFAFILVCSLLAMIVLKNIDRDKR
jgi:hypothetical protein